MTQIFAPVTRRMLKVETERVPAATSSRLSLSLEALLLRCAPPKPAIKTRTKTVGFQIISSGRANNMVSLLTAGVAGAMPELATCTPQGVYEAYAAFKDGDPALAAARSRDRLAAPDIAHGAAWHCGHQVRL